MFIRSDNGKSLKAISMHKLDNGVFMMDKMINSNPDELDAKVLKE